MGTKRNDLDAAPPMCALRGSSRSHDGMDATQVVARPPWRVACRKYRGREGTSSSPVLTLPESQSILSEALTYLVTRQIGKPKPALCAIVLQINCPCEFWFSPALLNSN